jgi:hypothetical protein
MALTMSGPDAEKEGLGLAAQARVARIRPCFDRNPGANRRRRIMTVVIPFVPRARKTERLSVIPPETGVILFFTGIRYERHAEPLPAVRLDRPAPRPASRAKRVRKRVGQPV